MTQFLSFIVCLFLHCLFPSCSGVQICTHFNYRYILHYMNNFNKVSYFLFLFFHCVGVDVQRFGHFIILTQYMNMRSFHDGIYQNHFIFN